MGQESHIARRRWRKHGQPAANINANVGLVQSIFFCVADVVFALFPLSFLWKLKMNRRTKMALAGVLSLGLVAAAFGIVRCVDLNEIGSRKDILFSTVDLAIWSFLEQNVTIIAACIPVLYTVFRTILGSRSTTAHYTDRTSSHGNAFDERKKYQYGSGSRAVRGKFGDELQVEMGTGWEGSTRAGSSEVDLEDLEAARKDGSEDGILEFGHRHGRAKSQGKGDGGDSEDDGGEGD